MYGWPFFAAAIRRSGLQMQAHAFPPPAQDCLRADEIGRVEDYDRDIENALCGDMAK
jgi:hypothetical protein